MLKDNLIEFYTALVNFNAQPVSKSVQYNVSQVFCCSSLNGDVAVFINLMSNSFSNWNNILGKCNH